MQMIFAAKPNTLVVPVQRGYATPERLTFSIQAKAVEPLR
jgi:hypothetical protein